MPPRRLKGKPLGQRTLGLPAGCFRVQRVAKLVLVRPEIRTGRPLNLVLAGGELVLLEFLVQGAAREPEQSGGLLHIASLIFQHGRDMGALAF